jgi:hypothetical protein
MYLSAQEGDTQSAPDRLSRDGARREQRLGEESLPG